MGESVVFSNFCVSNMLPLDMLAEVASETLKNDPTLRLNSNPTNQESQDSSFNKVCSQKRSATNGDVLTLEQIKTLSDKMLLEMFSEQSSDEIRRHYSYKCFLMPDKCQEIFSSFGNEIKARRQMRCHLLSHIGDLISKDNLNNNVYGKEFVAEPVQVRNRKLQEMCARKRKTGKSPRKKYGPQKPLSGKKMSSPKYGSVNGMSQSLSDLSYFPNSSDSISAPILNGKFTRLRKDFNILPKNKIEKENDKNNTFPSESPPTVQKPCFADGVAEDIGYFTCSSPKDKEEIESSESNSHSTGNNVEDSCNVAFPSNTGDYCENLWKSAVESIFCEPHKKENTEDFIYDHNYTSIDGKTYTEDDCEQERNVTKTSLKRMYTHKCPPVEKQLIISTPPFPYVYVPILPHISEVREVNKAAKHSCKRNLYSRRPFDAERSCSLMNDYSNQTKHPKDSKPKPGPYDQVEFKVEEESIPFNESSESTTNSRLSTESFSTGFLPEQMQDCFHNIVPGSERKLALKCIRALRAKKKYERGPLICQICKDKSFTAQATLMYHYRSHAGIKPFSCSVCEATFTRQHSLNYHMLIHDNKSRFICGDCGRNFRHPSHYKEHLRRHTGETPYQCTDCSLRFKTRNTYKRHLKTRHGKILTARGILVLSTEEFNKVRTSPRKKQSSLSPNLDEDEIQWQDSPLSDVNSSDIKAENSE